MAEFFSRIFSPYGPITTPAIISPMIPGIFNFLSRMGDNRMINKINENINGKFHITDFHYKFLTGFPNFTLALKDVELKDNKWNTHHHTLLKAKEIEARLNVWSLLQKEVNIHKILINDADIYIYKTKDGYTNSDIFKPKKKKTPENKSKPETTIDEIDLSYVHIIIDNQLGNKLFDFDVHSLKSKVDYDGDDWNTDLFLDTQIKSLAFNTVHGSFAKNKIIQGNLFAVFDKTKKSIAVIAGDGIGKEVMPEGLKVLKRISEICNLPLELEIFDFASWDY